MSVKIVVLYRRPENEESFMRHYNDVHLPLVRKLPSLEELTVSRVIEAPVGDSSLFLLAEMSFADRARLREAQRSPEYAAIERDLSHLAQGLATLMVVEER